MIDYFQELIEKVHLEICCNYHVEAPFMRERYRSDLGVSLCYFNYFQSTDSLRRLPAPEVDFFLCPGSIDLVVEILEEVFNLARVPRVG